MSPAKPMQAGWTGSDGFSGSKIALICAGEILVYLRDDISSIPFPGHWDLPGGGREGDESPETCALRELDEEFALRLPESRIVWSKAYPPERAAGLWSWFFVAALSASEIAKIRFGDEGQRWEMWPIAVFLEHDLAVPHLKSRLTDYLAASDRLG
ncbi:MAG: NUDIX hydrolase [Pseudomonadota bacterium]